MHIWIDADACPVVDLAVEAALRRRLQVTLVCDDAHELSRPGVQTLTVLRGADSADFYIINQLVSRDVLITQDYGLAAMALAKQAQVIDQNGRVYNNQNIEALLASRHEAKKIRRGGGRLKGPKKREKAQDEAFAAAFERLLEGDKNE